MAEIPISRVAVNQSGAGTTILASGQVGQRHQVIGGLLTLSASGTLQFTDDGGALTGPFDLAAQGGFVIPAGATAMIRATPGGALNLVTTGGAARGIVLVQTV